MKKYRKLSILCLIFGLLLGAATLQAQSHLKGQSALEASAGLFGPEGGALFAKGAFSKYVSSRGYYKLSFGADHKSYPTGNLAAFSRRYLAGAEYLHALVINRSGSFYFNVSAGATGGYEQIHVKEIPAGLEPKANSGFVYGPTLGVESELFLNDALALTLSLREVYLVNSELKQFRPYAGFGLKWILLK